MTHSTPNISDLQDFIDDTTFYVVGEAIDQAGILLEQNHASGLLIKYKPTVSML